MSKDPIQYIGNIQPEQVIIVPDPEADPKGFGFPVYATAPDAGDNVPGSAVFNSSTNKIEVARNDQTYVALAFEGASTNVVLATYDTDGEAPDVQGSIYLNNDDFPSTVRYYSNGIFLSLISAHGGAVNVFDNPIINLTPGSATGQAVEYDQFISTVVTPQYGGMATTAAGSPQTFPIAGTPQIMGGTYTATSATSGITVSGSTITNTSGGTLILQITLSASVWSTTGGSIATFYIAHNDSVSGQTGSPISLLSPTAPNAGGYSTILVVANGDTIKPYLTTDTNGDVLTVQSCYLNVSRP